VVQRGEQASLALEALPQVVMKATRLGDDLQRDVAVQARSRSIDLAHAARADEVEEFVRAESITRRERQVLICLARDA
jgi:hypothetical protein